MPCGDGTGPLGHGPSVGAGRFGLYRGWGCHQDHRGYGHFAKGPFSWGYGVPYSLTPEEEKMFLKQRAEWIAKQQEWIQQRLKDLGEQENPS